MAADPKVLVLTPDFPPEPGGIQVLVHRVVASWTGWRTRVVAINDEGAAGFDRTSGIDTVRAGRPQLPNRANVALLNAVGLRAGLRFRPDVVLSAHVVCSPAATALKRLVGAPHVGYLYADEIPATQRLTRFAMRQAWRSIVISEHTRQLAIEHGGDPSKLELVLPGVDLPERVQRRPSARPTILTVASMVKNYKGHDVMIRALPLIRARVPDVQWVVIGSGRLENMYRQMVRVRGLEEHVRFLGRVTEEERDEWLDTADVFVMPSRLRPAGGGGEGFGIVYLEAGAHGLPVVGGNVAGALDAVVDGETGLLVDPTDHVAVAEALARLLLDRELAQRLGTAGSRWAQEHAWPLVSRRVQDLLERTVAGA